MSIISSNSKNSFGKTINKMYKGRSSGAAKGISPSNPLASAEQKLGGIIGNGDLTLSALQYRKASTATIINSGAGGRAFKPNLLAPVRKRTAKDYS